MHLLHRGGSPRPPEPPQSVLLLGISQRTGKRIYLDEKTQENGVLMAAPPDKGKTSMIIVPGLYRELGHRSVFVLDPKQELVPLTAAALSRHHRVQVFAPLSPEHSTCWNPLALVRHQLDAEQLAASWMANTGGLETHNPFWTQCEKYLITAAVLHLASVAAPAQPPPFFHVRMLLSQDFDTLRTLFMNSPSEGVRDMMTAFYQNLAHTENVPSNIMVGLLPRLSLLTDRRVMAVTQRNELDFEAMGTLGIRPTALYYSVPDTDAEMLRPLTSIFLEQMFVRWLELANAQHPRQELPRPIVAYLDELGNAGKLPRFSTYVTACRSRRIAIIQAWHAFSQIDELWGMNLRKTMITAVGTALLFPAMGLDEVSHFSRLFGNTTIQVTSHSRRKHDVWEQPQRAEQGNETTSYAGRRLIAEDELHSLEDGELIVSISNMRPIRMWGMGWYDDREIGHLGSLEYRPHSRPVGNVPAFDLVTLPQMQVPPVAPQPIPGTAHPSLIPVLPAQPSTQDYFFPPEEWT